MTDEERILRFSCIDCSVDTSWVTGAGAEEYYMVHDEIWLQAVNTKRDGMLCIGCLEKRIGRELTPADFTDCLLNQQVELKSDRLLNRLGLSDD